MRYLCLVAVGGGGPLRCVYLVPTTDVQGQLLQSLPESPAIYRGLIVTGPSLSTLPRRMATFHSIASFLAVPRDKEGTVSAWINDDIRPLPPWRRTWTQWVYVSFWAVNQVCLSNWQLGSSLVSAGLSVWQTVVAVIIGKFIIAAVAVFNGYVGAEWHIGFPVWSRAVWGMYGSYLALLQRILLSLVW